MRKPVSLFASALVAVLASTTLAPGASAPTAPDLFRALPPGDVLITVDAAVIFGKAIPALLAGRPEAKAKLDANVAKLQGDVGLDLRQVRQIAISASLFDGARVEWVAVMDGKFDSLAGEGALARALDAYAKRNPRYSVRADAYAGSTIYVLPEKLAQGGSAERSAVALLDASTALYGTPSAVRRAVDAHTGKGPNAASNAVLLEAYGQADAASPVRLGMVLDAVVKEQMKSDPDDPFLKTLAGVRYLFGTLGVTGTNGLALKITSRASKPEDAKSVLATLKSLVDLARSQTSEKPDLAALVSLVTVTSAGNDVILSADIPPERLDTLFQLVDKNRSVIAAR